MASALQHAGEPLAARALALQGVPHDGQLQLQLRRRVAHICQAPATAEATWRCALGGTALAAVPAAASARANVFKIYGKREAGAGAGGGGHRR